MIEGRLYPDVTRGDLDALLALPARVAELEAQIQAMRDAEPLIGAETAARLLDMKPSALRKAAYRGTIPCVRVGRLLRFKASDLARRV